MSRIDIIMPKMGESVAEATIIKWVKNIGDIIEIDETLVEIATDKVDSEIPSIARGVLKEKLYQENDVVKVGEVIAIIENEEQSENTESNIVQKNEEKPTKNTQEEKLKSTTDNNKKEEIHLEKSLINQPKIKETEGERFWREIQEKEPVIKDENYTSKNINLFLSPLVKKIIQQEKVSESELQNVTGTGQNNRITKNDILTFLERRNQVQDKIQEPEIPQNTGTQNTGIQNIETSTQNIINSPQHNQDTEIIEMDRMRKLIAKHMVASKSISAHVTSFAEADVSKIVEWRNRIKNKFFEREKQKITYTPIIFEAVIKAIIDFPLINISVEGDNIIKHKNIHLGMATALPSGNLIVPVIKKAQEKNILGLTNIVNDLAKRARANQLQPDEVSGGTFTITNVGSFGSVMGTPIINQPQVAILALGKIQKKPTVIETEFGDTVGIRSKMFLSLSYDHRVVDGALGGQFLKRIIHYLESFDLSKEI